MEKLPLYRIVINEEDELTGVDFISLVDEPAIEINWMAFSSVDFNFKVEKDKQILYGPLMVADKIMYRNDEVRGEYNVKFLKQDIESIVKKFSKNNFNNNISFMHSGQAVKGTLVEHFIVREGMTVPGFENIPDGTWMGRVYIEDENFWMDYVKTDIVKGFSIEINGLLQRQDFSKEVSLWTEIESIVTSDISDEEMIDSITDIFKSFKFETYNDYPKAASENAARSIKLRDEYDLKCGTLVGWQRANQLAKGESISRETIARMAAFERHRQNSTGDPKESCGPLMWLAWGGDEGVAWAQRKLKQIDTALKSSAYQTLINLSSEKFIVEPKSGETKDEFIGRCIGVEVSSGYDADQATAICISKWFETFSSIEDRIEQLRVEEQKEYDSVDPEDKVKIKEIYDRYDKLITPLLEMI